MAEALCLVDSNILIRWVQPADPDYALVESVLAWLVRSGATHLRISVSSGTPRPARWSAMASVYRPPKQIDVHANLNRDCGYCPMA
jgi:hypothetical protein